MIYFSWATQIILAIISFLWLIPYYIAFKVGNRKYMSKTLDLSCNNRYTLGIYIHAKRTTTNQFHCFRISIAWPKVQK